jgi:outer membrane lipoprotein-sorting protein
VIRISEADEWIAPFLHRHLFNFTIATHCRKTMKSSFIVILCLLGSLGLIGQEAIDIIRKSEENIRGINSAHSEMTIEIVRPKWTREMTLKSWSLGDELSLIVVTEPARDRGTAFLKRGKEVWNWVPSIERTIKLPPSMMSQSWMGTDFIYDDLVRESSNIKDYTHSLLPEETINGLACHQIELIPKPEAPVVWGKVILFIDMEHFIQMRAEMYDEDGYLINTINSSEIKEMGNRTVATRMELVPEEKEGHKTVMHMRNMEFDISIEESFFTQQNMKRIQ